MDIQANLNRIIQAEAAAVQAIDVKPTFTEAVELIQTTKGRIVATGIGKAGFIARKFAATLASTGTPAFFIHPSEAGHGDLGMLAPEDAIVAFSTSGKSTEVIQMLTIAKQLGVDSIIGITSHVDSPLRALSQIVLDMGDAIKEPCPLGLTPSASIAVMLAISDAIALTVMELKAFTKEAYGMRHHSGYLGSISRKTEER